MMDPDSGVSLLGVRRGVTVVRLIFLFYTPRIWDGLFPPSSSWQET